MVQMMPPGVAVQLPDLHSPAPGSTPALPFLLKGHPLPLLQKGLEEFSWERQKERRGKTERVEVVVERGQGSSGERQGREAGGVIKQVLDLEPKALASSSSSATC